MTVRVLYEQMYSADIKLMFDVLKKKLISHNVQKKMKNTESGLCKSSRRSRQYPNHLLLNFPYRQVWYYERDQYEHMRLYCVAFVLVVYFWIAARKSDTLQMWNGSGLHQTHRN